MQEVEEVTSEHIIFQFAEYLKNDALGSIANLHTQIADNDFKHRAFNKDCLALS